MTTQTRNRLIAVGLVLLLAAIVLLVTFLTRSREETPVAEEQIEVTESPALGTSLDILTEAQNPLEPPVEEEKLDAGAIAAMQVAELFAERFGSYSNQGNYQNLRDLLPVMTSSYRAETEAFLKSVAFDPPAEEYAGYTSTKISTDEILYDNTSGKATFDIRMQQVSIVGTAEPEISYPYLRVQLSLVGEDWRVSSVDWRR